MTSENEAAAAATASAGTPRVNAVDEVALAQGPAGGWVVACGSLVGLSVCQSPMVFLTFGVFITPISRTFGWGRGTTSFALSACALTLALAAPVVGRAIDRFGARGVVLASMASFGILIASLSLLTASLWHYYLTFTLIGLCGAGANNVGFLRIVAGWFEHNRGAAIGIAAAGVPLGALLWPPGAEYLTSHYGWRTAYLALGLVVLLVALPIVTVLVRERPGVRRTAITPAAAANTGYDMREAVQHRAFWLLVGISFVMALALNGTQVHFIPLLTDHGYSGEQAAGIFALYGIGQLVSRLAAGRLFDLFFGPYVAIGALLCPLVSTILLLFGSYSAPAAIAAAVLLSIGSGAESDTLGYLSSRYFGLKSFGQIYGYIFGGFMLGTAVSPYLYGAAFDVFHSYSAALAVALALLIVLYALLLLLGPFPVFSSRSTPAG